MWITMRKQLIDDFVRGWLQAKHFGSFGSIVADIIFNRDQAQ